MLLCQDGQAGQLLAPGPSGFLFFVRFATLANLNQTTGAPLSLEDFGFEGLQISHVLVAANCICIEMVEVAPLPKVERVLVRLQLL